MYNNTKLFTKMLRFISKPKFNAFVRKFQADRHYRKFFSYQHFQVFMFAQYNTTISLRELHSAMNMHSDLKKILHLGSLNLSSLSRANNYRPYKLFESLFFYLLNRHASNLSNSERTLFKVIDGTFLTLSSKLFSWAKFSPDTKAVKLTFCMDLFKEIPEQVIINVGEADDNKEILKLNLMPGFTYICVCTHTSLTEDIVVMMFIPILIRITYFSSPVFLLPGHMKLKRNLKLKKKQTFFQIS